MSLGRAKLVAEDRETREAPWENHMEVNVLGLGD
jgi:hypothetical protein